jgi:predicted RNA-binding protein with PUA-like domain
MNYWLLKSEPEVYGIDDLAAEPAQTDHWDGVRNYQARNMMRDDMKVGDQAFFYHSRCEKPAVVGIVEIVREGYPDPTAYDPNAGYYDPKSDPDNPRWFMVDVKFMRKLVRPVTLAEIKAHPDLEEMLLVRRGQRLSIMPVTAQQWRVILDLEKSND